MRMWLLLVFLLWINTCNTWAQSSDSLRVRLQLKQAIVPVSLMTAGWITQGRISRYLQEEIHHAYPNFSSSVDDYSIYAPGVVSLGLAAAGVKGKNTFKEQLILAILSSVASQVVTQGLKRVIAYPRPDGSSYDAFPSGHTTMAFTSATLLHEEYGHRSLWYSLGGYTVATTSGAFRILNNRHWVSDVLMGAGVGIGATKGMYLVYPWAKTKLNKKYQK